MAKPYLFDLRERVMAFINAGFRAGRRQNSIRFLFPSAIHWAAHANKKGSLGSQSNGCKRHDALKTHRDWLLGQVKNIPICRWERSTSTGTSRL